MSLPYHKVDWDLVAEVRRTQGRVGELEKQVRELQRLVSATLAKPPRPPERPGRIRGWLIARRLGLRCLVCNRRAGYGGSCPNREHNA